jgi:hypothetical protein
MAICLRLHRGNLTENAAGRQTAILGQNPTQKLSEKTICQRKPKGVGAESRRRLDLHRAFPGKKRPNPPCAFALLQPDNRPASSVACATEMQNQVLAHTLSVREVFEVYNPAIGQTQKIHGKSDYQVSNKRTKKKNSPPATVAAAEKNRAVVSVGV